MGHKLGKETKGAIRIEQIPDQKGSYAHIWGYG
jgi:hypothetical protein